MPNIDLDIITLGELGFSNFIIWTTTEERVQHIIDNERCRSIFSKKEIQNLFNKKKMQMVRVEKIEPKKFDRIITWTDKGKWYILEFISFDPCHQTKQPEDKKLIIPEFEKVKRKRIAKPKEDPYCVQVRPVLITK